MPRGRTRDTVLLVASGLPALFGLILLGLLADPVLASFWSGVAANGYACGLIVTQLVSDPDSRFGWKAFGAGIASSVLLAAGYGIAFLQLLSSRI